MTLNLFSQSKIKNRKSTLDVSFCVYLSFALANVLNIASHRMLLLSVFCRFAVCVLPTLLSNAAVWHVLSMYDAAHSTQVVISCLILTISAQRLPRRSEFRLENYWTCRPQTKATPPKFMTTPPEILISCYRPNARHCFFDPTFYF